MNNQLVFFNLLLQWKEVEVIIRTYLVGSFVTELLCDVFQECVFCSDIPWPVGEETISERSFVVIDSLLNMSPNMRPKAKGDCILRVD